MKEPDPVALVDVQKENIDYAEARVSRTLEKMFPDKRKRPQIKNIQVNYEKAGGLLCMVHVEAKFRKSRYSLKREYPVADISFCFFESRSPNITVSTPNRRTKPKKISQGLDIEKEGDSGVENIIVDCLTNIDGDPVWEISKPKPQSREGRRQPGKHKLAVVCGVR